MGPLSEIYGRVPVLQIANLWFLVFNIACGVSKNKGEIIAFRFLSGLGGSAPLALGGGVLSDSWRAEERGRAISIYSLAPLLGPAIGPIAGGFITQNTTWRWAFYATSIADGVVQVLGYFFLRETYPPKLLHLKAEKLRKETGNAALHTAYEHPDRSFAKTMERSLIRPFRLLGTQPIVQVLAIYMAYLYGLMYLVLSTFPILWEQQYHESIGIGGLVRTIVPRESLDVRLTDSLPELHLPWRRLHPRHSNLRAAERQNLPPPQGPLRRGQAGIPHSSDDSRLLPRSHRSLHLRLVSTIHNALDRPKHRGSNLRRRCYHWFSMHPDLPDRCLCCIRCICD